jgi:trypsin
LKRHAHFTRINGHAHRQNPRGLVPHVPALFPVPDSGRINMRKVVCALALSVVLAASVSAITYGTPDGNRHPNVGLLVAKIGANYFALCSGTLVSETVFLTAGHCTDAITELKAETFVTFLPGPVFSLAALLPGTSYTHPDFGKSFPNTADIGVVVLNSPVSGITPALIPEAGFLDDLATRRGLQDTYFTHVGYGVQSVRPRPMADTVRYTGVSSLVNLTNAITDGFNLQTTANPGRGRSGICFGDSGGPAFYTDTQYIAAIHSFVLNTNCKGSAVSYRTDSATALEFLAGFGVYPTPLP